MEFGIKYNGNLRAVKSEVLIMKFILRKIILWPKKSGFLHREIVFEEDKINVITGSSRTGKSALIPIIDYCLGSNNCSIPVETIRDTCSWFGVLFELENEQILLCRKEPGLKASTSEMFMLRDKSIAIPEVLKSNTTSEAVKNILNELFSISFLEIDPSMDYVGSQRVSYRDFMAFLFQPQNIVANSDVLFYKADTMEHRQKLINAFPYILGAVTPEVLAARISLMDLRKKEKRLQKELEVISEVAERWKQEVAAWLSQAREIGLTDYEFNEKDCFEDQVIILKSIATKNETDADYVKSNRITENSKIITKLRTREWEYSSNLFALQKRQKDIYALKSAMDKYGQSLQTQLQRLEVSSWLKSMSKGKTVCPFCNSIHDIEQQEINALCMAISDIESKVEDMNVVPAMFEKELVQIEREIEDNTEHINAIRRRIIDESRETEVKVAEEKYTLSGISRFLGRLDASLKTLERIGKDSELDEELKNVREKIRKLTTIVNENDIEKKKENAVAFINQKICEIVQKLDAEKPDRPVEFVIKDLMIRIVNENGRKDYLWEIGSASNWLAYHVATILAFQQFFQKKGSVSIPNFLFFDQPSQVYFPQHRTNINLDHEEKLLADEDKEAVRKVFVAMTDFIKRLNYDVQIIVTEHADEDVWGNVESVHLVERWRGEGNKLIPQDWL